nr:GNAT family N-acetyltransferase [Bacteroides sp. Marseille-P3684]
MEIVHNAAIRQFFTEIDGEVAYVSYKVHSGRLEIKHTVVPAALSGRGLASQLVQAAFDYARANGLGTAATCPYAKSWLGKHPDYQ